jgi:AcrR family transcriptional regulator
LTRDTKKAAAKARIADLAWRLFADRGFAQVTVSEVARVAGVAEATIYNYFGTKQDLFFFRLDAYLDALVAAVADRPPEQSVTGAFRGFLTAPAGLLSQACSGDRRAVNRLRSVNRVVSASAALTDREQQSFSRAGDRLTEVLLAEAGADGLAARVTAAAVAHAHVAVHRALVMAVREAALQRRSAADLAELADQFRQAGDQAFALLERVSGAATTRDRPTGRARAT